MAKKNFLAENKWLILILILGFVLAAYPSFKYNLPIVQTDGASYYSYAKIYSETGDLNAANPEWNKIDALETKLSDYPPFFTITMGYAIKFFGNDVFWLNGFYLAIFFALANIFTYLLALELTKNFKESKKIALLAVLLSVLSARAYYHIFTGQYTLFVSICFAIPAIYFTVKYLYERKTKYFIGMAAFVLLAGLTYMQQLLYVVVIQFFILLGFMADSRLKLVVPKISARFKFMKQDSKDLLKIMAPTLLVFCVIFFVYGILPGSSGRNSFVQDWILSMMKPVGGFQSVWQKFFITDGPIFFTMALIGMVYLLYNQKWKILAPVLGGALIVISGSLFFVNDPMAKMLVFKFYYIFTMLIAIPAAVLFVKLLSNENTKKLFAFILALSIIIQLLMLGFFFMQVSPAISEEEYAASKMLLSDNKAPVAYIYDRSYESGFKSFKWDVVYARSENYDIFKNVPDKISEYKYVYVVDREKLTQNEIDSLRGYNPLINGRKALLLRKS